MSKFLFDNFLSGYSALISGHGWVEISKREKAPSYQRNMYENPGVYEEDGERRLPPPEVVYEAEAEWMNYPDEKNGEFGLWLKDLGVRFENDDFAPEFDNWELLRQKLCSFWISRFKKVTS